MNSYLLQAMGVLGANLNVEDTKEQVAIILTQRQIDWPADSAGKLQAMSEVGAIVLCMNSIRLDAAKRMADEILFGEIVVEHTEFLRKISNSNPPSPKKIEALFSVDVFVENQMMKALTFGYLRNRCPVLPLRIIRICTEALQPSMRFLSAKLRTITNPLEAN